MDPGGRGGRGPAPPAGPNVARGGGGRGGNNYYKRRWMYNKRGRGAFNGRGRGKNQQQASPTDPDPSSNNNSPPKVPKKKRTLTTVAENLWKKLLPGYQLYFHKSPPQLDEADKKIGAITQILVSSPLPEMASDFSSSGHSCRVYRHIDVDGVLEDEPFLRKWPNFEEELLNYPQQVITLWSAALHKVIYEALLGEEFKSGHSLANPPCVPKVRIGFFKSKPITPIGFLNSTFVDKFVTIRGAVVRTGNSYLGCPQLTFRCKVCKDEFNVEQNGETLTFPNSCPGQDCTTKSSSMFEIMESASNTQVMETRRVRIQDLLCEVERGSVPRIVDCILYDYLSDKCCSGDVVTLSGIIKLKTESQHTGERSMLKTYIEVSAIKQHRDSERTMGGNLLSFTDSDYYAIKEIHDTPDLFRFLVTSLCPGIYGHELIKAGLLLCLFGGTIREGAMPRRSDINMLMVGDPGLGKSQMLKIISEVAPRAVYVCGSGSTLAGLTVTLVRDGDDYSLEAGALVLADKGVCCIDEFDKMASQHLALLEAMEQQSVSVAKSGVFRTLPARATVIAAANPVGGHYNPGKTVSENIKINQALLSRFDLIFIILDKPDEKFDRKVFDHIRSFRKTIKQNKSAGGTTSMSNADNTQEESQETPFLKDLLKPLEGEVVDLLPHILLRKYIAYAKKYVHPKLSSEAIEVLKTFYMNMRKNHRGIDNTPVTSRQLESLVRLTEARAKLELREEATAKDAKEVLEIFQFSMSSSFDDEVNALSALSESVMLNTSALSKSGSKKSAAAQAKALLKVLQRESERQSKNIFSEQELKGIAAAIGFGSNANSLISTLNNEGLLLNKGGSTYKLSTANF